MYGASLVDIQKLCPITETEFDAAFNSRAESWPYFAKVLLSARQASDKPAPKPARDVAPKESRMTRLDREVLEEADEWDRQEAIRVATKEAKATDEQA